MLEKGAALDPTLAVSIAGQLASRDAVTAASYTERMPPEFRDTWFQQVAPQYAQQDPRAAVSWIQQFQGEPGYDNVLAQVIARAGQTDPQSAAMMLAGAAPPLQQSVGTSVAVAWAREDLAGAAHWAMELGDPTARMSAVGIVASSWVQRDPQAAQRWVAGLPGGEVRSGAATTVLASVLREGFEIDRRLTQTVGADVMQAAVQGSVAVIASRDPARARALVDEWITDPNTKELAQQLIDSQALGR